MAGAAHRRLRPPDRHPVRAQEPHPLGEMLAQEMGRGSGMTCWRRLRERQEAGVWDRLHHERLNRLGEADRIDWRRAALDGASVPARKRAPRSVPARRIAADRARSGTSRSTGGARPPPPC